MPRFTALDEKFTHQIPEPFPNTVTFHHDWRESLFFHMHPVDRPGDVVILTLAHFPAKGEMDSLQMGRVGEKKILMRHVRKVDGDQDDFKVGPVTIDFVEPLKKIHLFVKESPEAPLSMDITFTARTKPYGLRRGTMKAGHDLVWDQSHMFQSGTYNGTYKVDGVEYKIENWVGQRDHSWGIRSHHRVPCWIWLAVQLPEGMLGIWHWEYSNGALVYSDGCFAPSDGSEPIPVVRFDHDLHWTDKDGAEISYERDGKGVEGLAGDVKFTLQGGKVYELNAHGKWAQPYFGLRGKVTEEEEGDHVEIGGGLVEMAVTTKEGTKGTAIYEITGQYHYKYFPLARGAVFPPHGYSPAKGERAT